MSVVVIDGVPPYDGEYELNEQKAWNTREWRIIKQVSGYLPATIGAGYDGADPDLWIALTVIAMTRDGKIGRDAALTVAEALAEVPWDGASIRVKVEAPDEPPLGLTSEPSEPLRSGPLEKLSLPRETLNGSGESSPNGSETSGTTPPATTRSRSVTSSI